MLGKYVVAQKIKSLVTIPTTISSKIGMLRDKNADRKNQTRNLVSLAGGAQDNLLNAQTVFPFVLFTNTLKIDRQKVTIVHHEFFRTSHTISTRLKDVRNVKSDIGPLFGSITITSKHFLNNTQTIRYMKRKDIIIAQRLIQGFMIAHEANINTDDIETWQLLSLLNNLGQENR